jgi:hypothetical protein
MCPQLLFQNNQVCACACNHLKFLLLISLKLHKLVDLFKLDWAENLEFSVELTEDERYILQNNSYNVIFLNITIFISKVEVYLKVEF